MKNGEDDISVMHFALIELQIICHYIAELNDNHHVFLLHKPAKSAGIWLWYVQHEMTLNS
jgi:hypothetical protein